MNTFIMNLGQAGLLMTAWGGIGLIDATAHFPSRPPWYNILAVWLVSVAAMFVFAMPYYKPGFYVPYAVSGFFFVAGIDNLSIFLTYRFGFTSGQLPERITERINQLLALGVLCVLGLVIYLALNGEVNKNRDEVSKLSKEIKINQATTQRGALSRFAILQRTIDSLTNQLGEASNQNAQLRSEIRTQTDQIDLLTNVIKGLRSAIKSLTTSVERQRTSNINQPTTIKPQSPGGFIWQPIPQPAILPTEKAEFKKRKNQ